MKTTYRCAIVGAMLLGAAMMADAQSRHRTQDNDDDWGSKLDNEIERFVNRISKGFSWEADENDQGFYDDDSLPRKKRKRAEPADYETEANYSYSGNKIVEKNETLSGNVVVKGGDLTVYGTVDGDAMVVGGTLYVKEGGHVTGNARVINGSIEKEDGGRIDGYEDHTSAETANYRERRSVFNRGGTSFNVPWLSENTDFDSFIFRYNRVESIFLGFGTDKKFYWDGRKSWNSFGSVGWGFKSHTWRGNLGLARQFAFSDENVNHLIELGAEGYSLTDTKDQWIIGVHENTAAAFLIHEDFRDYFERNGITFHAAYYTQGDYLNTELKVAYMMDKYDSLNNHVEWALFGGDKLFRSNPAIAPGEMKSVMASFGLSTLTKTSRGPEGWNATATAEFARKDFGRTDWNFDQYIVDARRYQPLSRYDNINLRVRAGTSTGVVPLQRAFEFGGLGTLNAYPFKSAIGNRMLLINAEYIVNGSFLDDLDFWPTWLFRNFNFIVMSDAGIMRALPPTAAPTEGFGGITWGEFRHDLGFGFANRSGSFRIGVAWRTDAQEPAQFLFRFTRPF